MSGMRTREAPTVAQQRLLNAAADVFADRGFGGTTTRDIAAAAGRSPAAVYVHHPSKEHLLFSVIEWAHLRALDCLQAAYDSRSDATERLHEMVSRFSAWHMENVTTARVSQYELHSLDPEHRVVVVAIRREIHRVMRTALEAGIRDGRFEVKDLHRTSHSLLALCIDLIRWYDAELDGPVGAIARHNADLAVRMVSARRSDHR
jgi:AcrR family transcriptional regulator